MEKNLLSFEIIDLSGIIDVCGVAPGSGCNGNNGKCTAGCGCSGNNGKCGAAVKF